MAKMICNRDECYTHRINNHGINFHLRKYHIQESHIELYKKINKTERLK